MERSHNNLLNINQHDVKIMLQERILNPGKYIDKPLLIWRANFADGILRQVFFNFEPHVATLLKRESGRNEIAIPRWVQVKLDSLDDNNFFISGKDLNRVFCVILMLPDHNLVTPPFYEEYMDFINTDWLIREQERVEAPIVVFLPFIELPEAFKGYCQYIFTPDYNEWKKSQVSSHRQLIKHLLGFLDSSVSEEERNYRWYWYFQRQKDCRGSSESSGRFRETGCDFPSCWEDGIGSLIRRYNPPLAQMPKGFIPGRPTKISDISPLEFKDFFNKGISEDVIEDFRNYLVQHDAEVL